MLIWVLVILALARQHANATLRLGSDNGDLLSVSSGPPVDLEKGAGPALTMEEELAKVNSRIDKCIMVVLVRLLLFSRLPLLLCLSSSKSKLMVQHY